MKTVNIIRKKFFNLEEKVPFIKYFVAYIAMPVSMIGAVSGIAALFTVPAYMLGII